MRTPAGRTKWYLVALVAAALLALALALYLRGPWGKPKDAARAGPAFDAIAAVATASDSGRASAIELRVTDERWLLPQGGASNGKPSDTLPRGGQLVPTHGKLMHMFLVGQDLRGFAHLHPSTADTVVFASWLPPLPGGRYRVYGVVTRDSGLVQIATARITLRPRPAEPSSGSRGDDSWHVSVVPVTSAAASDRETMIRWERGATPLVAGTPAPLHFSVTDLTGSPVPIQPYMGVPAHSVVIRDDHLVFAHLAAVPRDSAAAANAVSFLYSFPSAGRYRVWVQLKNRRGRVVTGAFDAVVEPAPPARP